MTNKYGYRNDPEPDESALYEDMVAERHARNIVQAELKHRLICEDYQYAVNHRTWMQSNPDPRRPYLPERSAEYFAKSLLEVQTARYTWEANYGHYGLAVTWPFEPLPESEIGNGFGE